MCARCAGQVSCTQSSNGGHIAVSQLCTVSNAFTTDVSQKMLSNVPILTEVVLAESFCSAVDLCQASRCEGLWQVVRSHLTPPHLSHAILGGQEESVVLMDLILPGCLCRTRCWDSCCWLPQSRAPHQRPRDLNWIQSWEPSGRSAEHLSR